MKEQNSIGYQGFEFAFDPMIRCQSSDTLADLLIILTSSNECMAYLTLVPLL